MELRTGGRFRMVGYKDIQEPQVQLEPQEPRDQLVTPDQLAQSVRELLD
jgi:hypothetical protein